ncbi:hypothetical protein GEMRC1_011433 [Eukaryota sp. GEM-RC1]
MSLGIEEGANDMIEQLITSSDSVIRYGGVYSIGLAFAGSGNPGALKKLLSIASTDTSDDVKRSSVIMIGLVMASSPTDVVKLVSVSSRSHNPHLRYGAALALAVSCAGTANKDALEILSVLTKDTTDFVRQGAFIALGFLLQCTSPTVTPKNMIFRKEIMEILRSKYEDSLVKFGGMLALGLMDVAGRNGYFTVISPKGSGIFEKTLMKENVLGLVLFLQYWFWIPYSLGISLSIEPAGLMGVLGNSNLEMPEMKFNCDATPSTFSLPKKYSPPEKKKDF